jgi:hypothetical protein
MTKAQGLVLWSLSRGLISIPRSGVGSEVRTQTSVARVGPPGMRLSAQSERFGVEAF